ncbi:MAG: response regulator transcription factor [Polyangiales bacterium]
MRILLVEDSPRVVDVVCSALRASGHAVEVAGGVEAAYGALREGRFDVAVVDVGLPDGDGLDLCRHVRRDGLDRPILRLTARNEVRNRVDGLDAGADDYLGKPFAPAELTARVRALGRRGPRFAESVRSFGALTIDRDRHLVTRDGARVPLTPREHEIVAHLAWRDGRVVGRDDLLEAVWGEASPAAAASLEVLITRIRRKLAAPGEPEVIRTVRQVGYAWARDRSKRA